MGYYTFYTIDMVGNLPEDPQKIYDFAKERDMEFTDGFSVGKYGFDTNDMMKWYDHETEMRKISKEFPHILFKLHGEGEEKGDIWDEYYRAGKMQHCDAEIVIPPFDESKMT